jgi:hypothetical protein
LETVRGLGVFAVVVRDWKEMYAAQREAGYVSDVPLFEGVNVERENTAPEI